MKVEDSGMPEEQYWNSLFNIEGILSWLNLSQNSKIVEIGCGYGTFTIPIAAIAQKSFILAFDIEPEMISATRKNLVTFGLTNAECVCRDILAHGTGLSSESVALVLLFNILHFNEKRVLLQEASRILKSGGIAAILHWRKDIPTPRGPDIALRPDKEQIMSASEGLNLRLHGDSKVLEPYHWGIQLIKGS
ncbi:MAG: class I SAM-dependent methyltransferase [Endomicrobiia bacterium]|nr:class I SAM-dependent methyltransferase [Endomicrobiia bacterium]